MTNTEALPIINALANATNMAAVRDALHGTVTEADLVRALLRATDALQKAAKTEAKQATLPARIGQAWTDEEDRKLLSQFDAGRGLSELATMCGRTQSGVRARLVKYGRLPA